MRVDIAGRQHGLRGDARRSGQIHIAGGSEHYAAAAGTGGSEIDARNQDGRIDAAATYCEIARRNHLIGGCEIAENIDFAMTGNAGSRQIC
ncbi:hypothetical protein, partial [Rhizobium sp. BR 315]|uniref:hypothetical protein n=1 Tax=Rhizobium sp. BR 315 TaxID=3040014 RepID=UPI003D33FB38